MHDDNLWFRVGDRRNSMPCFRTCFFCCCWLLWLLFHRVGIRLLHHQPHKLLLQLRNLLLQQSNLTLQLGDLSLQLLSLVCWREFRLFLPLLQLRVLRLLLLLQLCNLLVQSLHLLFSVLLGWSASDACSIATRCVWLRNRFGLMDWLWLRLRLRLRLLSGSSKNERCMSANVVLPVRECRSLRTVMLLACVPLRLWRWLLLLLLLLLHHLVRLVVGPLHSCDCSSSV